jgi:hypothetical protein
LRQIVLDEHLDERLCDVAWRPVVAARARIIPHHRSRSRIGRWALAASLLIAVSMGYASWLGGLMWLLRPVERPTLTLMVMDEGPFEFVSPTESAVAIDPGPTWEPLPPADDLERWPPDRFPLLATMDHLPAGPAGQLFTELGTRWDPAVHWMRLRWPVFGYSHPEAESLPDLEMVSLPIPRGRPALLTREFDREFLFSRGWSPPVMTPANSDSHRLTVPLSQETSSWDLLRQEVRQQRLPAPEQLQAEHFLAALDFRLPPAEPGRVALRSAAGPSSFNPSPAGLLQISVKAGEPRRWPRPATHLTVALDSSASMDWDQRFAAAREGIVRALCSLRPADRFSLIVFREQPYWLVDEARYGDLPAVFEALDSLNPAGSANLAEVLPQAMATALETDATANVERRLVLITDSPADLVPEAAAMIERVLSAAGPHAFGFDVLDLGERPDTDPQISRLAKAAGGNIQRVRTAEDIRWALFEKLRGTSEQVAKAVELTVEFNPQAVAAYRLIGHQCQGAGGFGQSEMTTDMRVGEELTSLFEVWLYPNDVDEVASARVRWLDPHHDNREATESIRVSRQQFSSTLEGSAISLQEASIIAESVEVLGQAFHFDVTGASGYRYSPKARDLRQVFWAVERANPQLEQRADFQRILNVLEMADQISTERPGATARSGSRGIIAQRWRESKE